MKKHIYSILFWVGALLTGVLPSCTDDLIENQSDDIVTVDDTDLVEAGISLNVAAMSAGTVSSTTRAGDNENYMQGTDAERRIDNIWVFQFDATSRKLLITPRYYDISALEASPDEEEGNGQEVKVLLKPDVESIVYVVANTGVSDWATASDSPTLDSVMHKSLPQPDFIPVKVNGDLAVAGRRIPMEGASETVTPQNNGTINVKVTRMFAKVEISIGYIPETLDITDVQVGNIPDYCRVSSLDLDDENDRQPANYPTGTDWMQYSFKPKDDDGKYGTMVIYLPENLQGQLERANPNDQGHKTSQAFADALYLNFIADYKNLFTGNVEDAGRSYVFYPGANDYSDYNIKRNNIYKVTLDIYTDRYNTPTPSSNCFVVKPGQLLSFLPYYRTEEGGGYKFTDYLNPVVETLSINDSTKMTENVRIIWQTKDAIGDNTKGDKVWIDRAGTDDDTRKRKIYVRAGEEGNALIAAFNKAGEILWSWHIWVTSNEPANLSSAVVYSTYAWNETGIITSIRVPGYAIMPCNLGALRYEPQKSNFTTSGVDPDTHGMLYQWGRKDPFPPARKGDNVPYNDEYTGTHYGNDNTTPVTKTSDPDGNYLFHTLPAKNLTATTNNAIKYTIKHPTVFLCGTKEANQSETYIGQSASYLNNGDWREKHDDKLWGGKVPSTGGMKYLTIKSGVHIFDNYGDQKSIFDPCPTGWRVPPGDLWLGFTSTGIDPRTMYEVNTDKGKNDTYLTYENGNKDKRRFPGMYMYMTGWQSGETVFFPTQGTLTPDGRIMRTGSCGNYHNATTDLNNRVNILHVHNDQYDKSGLPLFHVFETQYRFYYVKSCGGPVRCVRDHK